MTFLSMQYGRIVALDLKTPPRPPAYAFVEFEDPRYEPHAKVVTKAWEIALVFSLCYQWMWIGVDWEVFGAGHCRGVLPYITATAVTCWLFQQNSSLLQQSSMTAHFERDYHCRDAQDAVGGRDNYDFHGRSPVNMASRIHGADVHRCNTNFCQMQGPQHSKTPAGNRLRVEISHGRAPRRWRQGWLWGRRRRI